MVEPAALVFVEGSVVAPVAGLPDLVADAIGDSTWSTVRGGVSDASVHLLRDADGSVRFLKAAAGDPTDPESPAGLVAAEHANLVRLAGLLPVAEVVAYTTTTAAAFLLTTAVAGSPATDPDHHQDADALVRALAEGLRRVHDLPLDGRADLVGLEPRLRRARTRVGRGLVDRADFEPAYARFTPERLLELLEDARPAGEEDLVVVHGDPTCSNLLLGLGTGAELGRLAVTGYVDLDRAGVADRYLDLAIAARSLARNLSPEALGPFFHAYGIEAPDLLKVDFYVLLDEFM